MPERIPSDILRCILIMFVYQIWCIKYFLDENLIRLIRRAEGYVCHSDTDDGSSQFLARISILQYTKRKLKLYVNVFYIIKMNYIGLHFYRYLISLPRIWLIDTDQSLSLKVHSILFTFDIKKKKTKWINCLILLFHDKF